MASLGSQSALTYISLLGLLTIFLSLGEGSLTNKQFAQSCMTNKEGLG